MRTGDSRSIHNGLSYGTGNIYLVAAGAAKLLERIRLVNPWCIASVYGKPLLDKVRKVKSEEDVFVGYIDDLGFAQLERR